MLFPDYDKVSHVDQKSVTDYIPSSSSSTMHPNGWCDVIKISYHGQHEVFYCVQYNHSNKENILTMQVSGTYKNCVESTCQILRKFMQHNFGAILIFLILRNDFFSVCEWEKCYL